ncbi:MAG: NUDIX domain-containing protein [Blastocatellia bacterium]
MSRNNGPWVINETTLKYRNDFIEVNEDRVIRPDGEPGTYATVDMKAGLAVLPVGEDRSVYLTRQFRYAIGRESIEVVGGAIDEGEDAEAAARRELREEVGIEAGELTPMGVINIDTSIVDGAVSLFLARRLRFTEPDREGTEVIKPLRVTLDEAVNMVMSGEINQGTSCVLILKAGNYLGAR